MFENFFLTDGNGEVNNLKHRKEDEELGLGNIFWDEAGEGNCGERMFDFDFQFAPHFIRLAVTGLEAGECPFYGWEEYL